MKFLIIKVPVFVLIIITLACCAAKEEAQQEVTIDPSVAQKLDTAIFASGCFWCTEAVFERIEGVVAAESGYSGGTEANPTYQDVSAGHTNHAEAVRVFYDPAAVSYEDLVEIFFGSHDPTQLNRQGPDVGKQYRSAIFYRNITEKKIAEKVKAKLNEAGKYNRPIVTEITNFISFYKAEDYHQGYYEIHPNDPYIFSVSKPKVEKFMKEFQDKLKREYREQ